MEIPIMYIVRNTFTARPGMASKLAAVMKKSTALQGMDRTRVLTDAVGTFNTVVMEHEVEDLAGFERRMEEYGSRQDVQEVMRGYTDLYISGTREIFRVL
jgi:hypothetical protein